MQNIITNNQKIYTRPAGPAGGCSSWCVVGMAKCINETLVNSAKAITSKSFEEIYRAIFELGRVTLRFIITSSQVIVESLFAALERHAISHGSSSSCVSFFTFELI